MAKKIGRPRTEDDDSDRLRSKREYYARNRKRIAERRAAKKAARTPEQVAEDNRKRRDRLERRPELVKQEEKNRRREDSKAYYAKNKDKIKEKWSKTRDEKNAKVRAYYAAHPEKMKQRNKNRRLQTFDLSLRKRYGITWEDRLKKVQEQDGKCAICSTECNELVVDHNHKTGRVRGLLCRKCNTLLGMADEDALILQAASEYLNRYNKGNRSPT